MPAQGTGPKLVRFGVFEVDLHQTELRKQGAKVKLQEQPFKILKLLLETPGQIVSREHLRTHIWPANTFVEFDKGLYSAMARLRDVLGDNSESPQFIETVARQGYRFIAPITAPHPIEPPSQVPLEPPTIWTSGIRRLAASLSAGLLGGGLLLAIVLGLNVAGAREWLYIHTHPVHSIAVLPFEDLSHDPEQEYFADGMTDELITRLAGIGVLRIISRTSAMRYKGTKKTLPQIGRELNVDAIVEGSIIRSGDRIRVTAQLIQTANDQHLWARDYQRDLGEVLLLQNELAQAIVAEIASKLTASERKRLVETHKINSQAYQFYLQARYFADLQSREALQKAVDSYQRALAIDPGYAPFWAGLGDAYGMQASIGVYTPEEDGWRKSREALGQALKLDPDLADAHALMGGIQMFHDWDWQGAETSLQRAMELEPNDAKVLQKKALLSGILGQPTVAIALDRRAIALDPLSAAARSELGTHAYFAGHSEEALSATKELLDLDPEALGAHWGIALINLERGRAAVALQEAQLERDQVFRLMGMTLTLNAVGRKKESNAALNELIEKFANGGAFQIAEVYGFLGDTETASKWLDRAYLQHDSGLPFVKEDPAFKRLHGQPHFTELLRRMGLLT